MDESYVELMWRVVKERELKGAFLDLDDADEYAKKIGGKVIVITHKDVEPICDHDGGDGAECLKCAPTAKA